MRNNDEAKREMTTEELKAQMKAAHEQYETLSKTIADREKAEAEAKRIELSRIKDARYAEIKLKREELDKLVKEFIKDYGSLSFTTTTNDNTDFWWDPFFRNKVWF